MTTLRPEDVRKIEYYDLPPIKFGLSNGNKVINIITKIREDGIYGSVELNQHLTSPWLNDSFSCNTTGDGISWHLLQT